jgi:hypothetical protein
LPRNNLNKNYFRFSKETNQKERRKSTSYISAEGNEGVAAILYYNMLYLGKTLLETRLFSQFC